MAATIHANARTTPKIRAEIQAAPPSVSNAALARRFGVTKATVAKWRCRDQVHDGSHRPHRLNTTLTEAQEAVVVAVRELLLLPLDDLLVVAWEFLNPNLSRSALDRCLRRHGVNNLKAMLREQEGEAASDKPYKSFKDYEPGFVHVDIKYLPQMAGESARSYLFVAIDRATRWVYLEIRKDKSARSARAFLNKLIQAAPFKIQKILTDNDKAFTDRFSAAGERKPTGTHPFDVLCQAHGIEHRLIKPRRPQTNGMVERFNGRIAEILQTTRFDSSKDLKQTLLNYREVYNHHIPQRALGHVTPIQALKQWQQKRPEIFVKKVYNHAGLDSYKVLFTTALALVEKLELAEIKGELKKQVTALQKFDLLIIDELGYLPMNRQARYNLFQLVNALYEYRSVIITTNKDFTAWGEFFADDNVAVPIVDRLIHHSHIFMLGGESYRLKHKRES